MHFRPSLVVIFIGSLALGSAGAAADISVADGVVAVDNDGKCSLREALINANLPAGGDTTGGECAAGSAGDDIIILFPGSLYTVADQYEDLAGWNGLPVIRSNITIDGQGAIIQRDPALFTAPDPCDSDDMDKFRFFAVDESRTLTLEDLTLQYGCSSATCATECAGGAIITTEHATLNLTDVTVRQNASRNSGGAILNCGTANLTRTSVRGNTAVHSAGGIQNDDILNLVDSTVDDNQVTEGAGGGIVTNLTLTMVRSTLSRNTSTNGSGGGFYNSGESMVLADIGNSTISGNFALGTGGGVQSNDPVVLTNATITDNTALNPGNPGGGIFRNESTVTLANTIVGSQSSGGDCGQMVTSNGNNLDSDGTCGLASGGDISGMNPVLGPLRNNGGPTQTHALLASSPAIDTGDNATCAAPPIDKVDQRGVGRPIDGDGNGFAICDIGAFEAGPFAGVPLLSAFAGLLLIVILMAFGLRSVRRQSLSSASAS